MDDLKYIYHGRRYWTMEPTRNDRAGWNTDFVPCPVFKVTAKRIGILSPYLGVLWLNREAFDRDGKVYHSKPHEWFYRIRPTRDPEHPGPRYYEVMAELNGTSPALAMFGLSPNCSKADVKRAYKRLAPSKHPDTGGSHEAFIELNEAYEKAMVVAR